MNNIHHTCTHAGKGTVGTVVNLVKWLERLLLQKLDEIPEIRLLTNKLGTQFFGVLWKCLFKVCSLIEIGQKVKSGRDLFIDSDGGSKDWRM